MYSLTWHCIDNEGKVHVFEKVFDDYDMWCRRIDMLDKDIEKGVCVGYIATKVQTFMKGFTNER